MQALFHLAKLICDTDKFMADFKSFGEMAVKYKEMLCEYIGF